MYDFMEKQFKNRNTELAASRAAASSATTKRRQPPRRSTASERIATATTKKASHKIASTLGSYWGVQIEHKHKNATENCSTNIARTMIVNSRIRRATSNLSTHNSSTTSTDNNSNNNEEGSSSSSTGRKKRKNTASDDSVTKDNSCCFFMADFENYAFLQRYYLENQIRPKEQLLDGMTLRRLSRK